MQDQGMRTPLADPLPLEWAGRHQLCCAATGYLPATQGQRYPYRANRAPDAPPGTER
jgi:hypothetical protein